MNKIEELSNELDMLFDKRYLIKKEIICLEINNNIERINNKFHLNIIKIDTKQIDDDKYYDNERRRINRELKLLRNELELHIPFNLSLSN